MGRWQLQDAKQQFSRVVSEAEGGSPQIVTRHGREVAVVLGIDEYRRLGRSGRDVRELLLGPPYVEGFEIERSSEPPRELDLA